MRIDLAGSNEVVTQTTLVDVVAALTDPAELLEILDGLLHPSSTNDRWIVSELHAGPLRLRPAVTVAIARDGNQVHLTGQPVAGYTPTHLAVTLQARDRDTGTTVASSWRIEIDLPGPQLIASSIRPLLDASARSGSRRIADRVRQHFTPHAPEHT